MNNIRIRKCNIMLSLKPFGKKGASPDKAENRLLDKSLDSPKYPLKVASYQGKTLWFQQDFKYKLSNIFCNMYIRYLDDEYSPEIFAMSGLFMQIFKEKVKEPGFSILEVGHGLFLKFSDHKMSIIEKVELIMDQIEKFFNYLDDESFIEGKQQLLISYHYTVVNPTLLARDLGISILIDENYGAVEVMKAIENIEKDHFLSTYATIFIKSHVDVLVQGDMQEEEAKNLFSRVVGSWAFTEHMADPKGRFQYRMCKPGENIIRVKSLYTTSPQTCIRNFYQGYCTSVKEDVINILIVMLMQEHYYPLWNGISGINVVYCENLKLDGISTITISVNATAEKHSRSDLNDRIELYLEVFLEKLSELSEEELNCKKEKMKFICDDLEGEANVNFDEIVFRTYMFERRHLKMETMPSITLEEVTSYLQAMISPSNNNNYRKLSVQVEGYSSPNQEPLQSINQMLEKPVEEIIELMDASPEDIDSGLSTDQFVKHIRSLENQLSWFE